MAAPLGQLPIFVRAGCVLPIATDWDAATPRDAKTVSLTVFITSEPGQFSERLFFDDRHSWHYQDEAASLVQVDAKWDSENVYVNVMECWSGESRPDISVSTVGLANRTIDVSLT